MRIGVFGGSFNPVHPGHLALAEEALSELNLDRVIFVPAFKTPLKKSRSLWPLKKRLELLKKVVRNHPRFSVSLIEAKRQNESFTVDTLRFLKRQFGKRATLYFLAGADSLKTLSRWKSVAKIFSLCRFVVMTRPAHSLYRKTPWPVLRLPFEALDISSSQIRESARRLS